MIMKTNTETGRDQNNFSAQSNFGDRCVASCRKLLAQLEDVKANVVAEFRDKLEEHQHVLELAVNEAEALAWQTGFPQFVSSPHACHRESALRVAGWHRHHQLIQRHTSPRLITA